MQPLNTQGSFFVCLLKLHKLTSFVGTICCTPGELYFFQQKSLIERIISDTKVTTAKLDVTIITVKIEVSASESKSPFA